MTKPVKKRAKKKPKGDAKKPMSKTAIVSHIAERTSTPKKKVALFFEELHSLAVNETKGRAGKFVIPGIGRLVKAHRKARIGRNPQTGEAIKVKAKTVVRLRPAKVLKEGVLRGNGWPD
jgi:DNA-binding protein HU-beta